MIENSGSGTDLITIAADEDQTQYCGYSIPLGYTGYLLSAIVQVDASKAADFRLFTRENLTDNTTPFSPKRLRYYWDGVLGIETFNPDTPILKLPALTDIWIEARGGGAITEVSADIEILLVTNS